VIYVETVFGLPGLALVAVRAISGENGPFDLPVILGIVFVVAVTVVLLTLIVDLLYGFLDPRIRMGSEARA
jgi:peptide/nickel transport system permease protein